MNKFYDCPEMTNYLEVQDEKRKYCCGNNCDEEEYEICQICGGTVEKDEMHGGVCNECIEKHGNNIDTCYEIGKKCKDKVAINCFLASMFTDEEIEELLLEALRRADADCSEFIEGDKEWFGEALQKEVRI